MTGERRVALLIGGSLCTVIAIVLEMVAAGEDALETDVWHPTPGQLSWTFALAAGTASVVLALASWRRRGTPPPTVGRTWHAAAQAGAAAIVLTGMASPWFFDRVANEDRPVEYLSAAVCFVVTGTFLWLASRWSGWLRVFSLVLAAAFFFVGMEEVSWFQRLLDFDTPAGLAEHNEQTEANLHNVATDLFQNLYYTGATVLFFVVPVAHRLAGRGWQQWITALVPGSWSVSLAVLSVPFAYSSSSYPAHHLSVWWCAAVLLVWFNLGDRPWAACLGVQVILSIAAIRWIGPQLARDWAPSEYRELFIAGAVLAWGVELVLRERGAESVGGERSHDGTALRGERYPTA